ncbi:uncharacterized protein LOC135208609 [Macrobrachium nipponense]|uniref:uncharacterized protein LOC135208609 n=1 Tax=Macrobrachium nipponense TaxID=159736 RepID=UPI0030C87522
MTECAFGNKRSQYAVKGSSLRGKRQTMSRGKSDLSDDGVLREEEETSAAEAMEDQGPQGGSTDEAVEKKICGVCGDTAKSYHFGGLCCSSCKAFFRRSIQSEAWQNFFCLKDGVCVMRENRRACQACRFDLCKKIGMDTSLVMNAEDRKALMLRKLEKRKKKLLRIRRIRNKQQKNNEENEKICQHENSTDWDVKVTDAEGGTGKGSHPEETNDECLVVETLDQKSMEKIKGLRKMLRKALTFPEFPKHYYEGGTDITEHLFFVFCKGMGKFFSILPEFSELDDKDQNVLLKDAVAKSIFIFGAHQFQRDHECWPRRLLSPCCTFPTISLAATEQFIYDEDTFQRMKIFMRKFCRFFDDEVVTLLSLMIAAFDTDISLLVGPSKVAEYKEVYTQLLENYLHYQSPSDALTLFTNELRNCFAEVKALKKSFQRNRTEKEEAKPLDGNKETSFASSLHDLKEDPKMAPKKAFFERNKVTSGYHSHGTFAIKDEHNWKHKSKTLSLKAKEYGNKSNLRGNEEIEVFELPPNPCITVTQDHNYQKLNARRPRATLHDEDRFYLPDQALQSSPSNLKLHKKLEGIGSNRSNSASHDTDYQAPSRQSLSPALIIPLSRRRNDSLSGRKGLQMHQNEIQVDYPIYCSGQDGFQAAHQQSFHDAGIYRPIPLQTSLLSANSSVLIRDQRHQQYIPSADISFSPEGTFPTLPLKAVPVHLPSSNCVDMCGQPKTHCHPHARQVNLASELRSQATEQDFLQFLRHSPKALSSGLLQSAQSNPQLSSKSPMINVCQNVRQLSTQDDQQLVEAVQYVLPPHLMKHLITRLGAGQRNHL